MVRVEPVDKDQWLLSRDDRLNGHRVSPLAAAIVVRAFGTVRQDDLVVGLTSPATPSAAIRAIVDWLLAEEYLVDPASTAAISTAAWLSEWNRNGWRAAAKYHARTFGYPFEFYEADGSSAEDFGRMVAYNAQRPDVDRAKERIPGAKSSYAVPVPAAELNKTRAGTVADRSVSSRAFDREGLIELLALVSRPVRIAKMPYPEAAPLLRKTSPSGGSRHPTEFYVIASGVAGLTDGIYQVASVDGVLDSVDTVSAPPTGWLDLFQLPAPSGPSALVVYSCKFERNRYRYREPRTFRTVHMDVGHLMTTCEFVGRANGWDVAQVQHLDGAAVSLHLGLDKYVECPLAATLLSNSDKQI